MINETTRIAWVLMLLVMAGACTSVKAQTPEAGPSNAGVQFDAAELKLLGEQLEQNPGDHLARRQYADALFAVKRYREAAAQYEVFLQHFQGAPDTIHRLLISIAGYPGDNDKGERLTARYLTFYPADHELYMRLGYFRLWQGKYEEALGAFERALQLRPDHFESQEGSLEARAAIELDQRLGRSIPTMVADSASVPLLDEQRFRFVNELMRYQRYSAAFDELMILAERHDQSRRWLALYAYIDAELTRLVGVSPAFPVDRYRYLLAHQPDNIQLRYALVEELVGYNRIGEAYETLLAPDHVNPFDSVYVDLLAQIDAKRDSWLNERIALLQDTLAQTPQDSELLRELIDLYHFARQPDMTLDLYRRWLTLCEEDRMGPDGQDADSAGTHIVKEDETAMAVRLNYAQALYDAGFYNEALKQTERLLTNTVQDIAPINLYIQLVTALGLPRERAMNMLTNYLVGDPSHVEARLQLSELYLADQQPLKADTLLRQAYTLGRPEDMGRINRLDFRIGSTLLRSEQDGIQQARDDALERAANGDYGAAIEAFNTYMERKNERTHADLRELARLHTAAGEFTRALSILYELHERSPSPDLWKDLGKNRYYLGDHAGALLEMEPYVEAYPRDIEAKALLRQIYVEVQQYALADSVARYTEATDRSTLNETYRRRVRERLDLLERAISTDYVGLVVPISQYIRAEGSITSYEHWAQGLLTQVTMPAEPRPFVLTAGLISHFVEGTRRLTADTPFSLSRVNQVLMGGYFDLTSPSARSFVGYTNRLRIDAGVFDYSGGRTAGFAELSYLRHQPDRYNASVSIRNTEGGIYLWSPAGGEFGLRLTQFETKWHTRDLLPDSTLRITAELDVNLVKGLRDSTQAQRRRNAGTDIRLEASYRLTNYLYAGLSFNAVSFRHTLETYFSPSRYRAYDLWVEYERELIGRWFSRSRLTTGIAFYRRGSFAIRGESDLIYRFADQLSFSINASAGYSVRLLDGGAALRDERFRMILFSAALYWTL